MLKRLFGCAILLLAVMASSPEVKAQSIKIGYTNQEAILANMPEMEQVRQQLQQEQQQQEQEFISEQQEFQQKLERYQKQQELLSEERRAEREAELRELQAGLQQSAQRRDQQLAQRQMELMQPLLEELRTAINEVADEQNIGVVMRAEALLYVDQNNSNVVNITREVATRLGIEVDDADAAPAPTVDQNGAAPNGN